MNILFLMKFFSVGGLEIKTAVLANEFLKSGHSVTFVCFNPPDDSMLRRLDHRIDFLVLNGFKCSRGNVRKLRSILTEHRIDIVINQWGLPFIPLLILKLAATGLKIKIVSAYYNDPAKNNRIVSIDQKLKYTQGMTRWCLQAQRMAARLVTGLSMYYNYRYSDKYVLLSESFIPRIREFAFLKKTDKIVIIPNPLTRQSEDYMYEPDKKGKEILYVGRLENIQKRVDLALDVWAQCRTKFPDWKFTIVGDGPNRKMLEKKVAIENIGQVFFEGKQDPTSYYKRASILLLTSEYEGFGIVLTECMCFGVVPIVYGSFSSVYDIVTNEKDGLIVPYDRDGLNVNEISRQLMRTMRDRDKLGKMGEAAIEASKRFSINKVYPLWQNLFDTIE